MDVAVHGDVVIVFGGDEILPFQVEQLQIVAIRLPEVAEVGAERQFQFLPFEAAVLEGERCIPTFAAAVAVEDVEADGHSGVEAEVASSGGGVDVVLIKGIAVAGVEAEIGVVA